jgi:hypothetical protein
MYETLPDLETRAEAARPDVLRSREVTAGLVANRKWRRSNLRLQSFKTELLDEEEDIAGLGRLNNALIGRTEGWDSVTGPSTTWIPARFSCTESNVLVDSIREGQS